MSVISATAVRDLREKTGAGMMDCKKALSETNGDFEAAVDWLRTKGLSKAAKKSDRVAAEGVIAAAISADGTTGAMIELNAETDFVARNEKFQEFAIATANDALTASDFASLASSKESELTNLIATIGENMTLRRADSLSVDKGTVATYIHGALAPNVGKIGVMVALEGEGDLSTLGKQIGMHIAATNPLALSVEDLDADVVERERQVFITQAQESGKPEGVIEKMVEGRIRKFFEESVLLEQTFVVDGESKIKDLLKNANATLKSYLLYRLGDGIEKGEEEDFAAEVAKMAGNSN